MIRDEQEFATKIKGYLDSGTAAMDPDVRYRLQKARARALAHLDATVAAVQPELALAGVGPGSGSFHRPRRMGWWAIVGVVALGMLFFGYQAWHTEHRTGEIADLDVQILTSDLPIDAYVDRGFQTWLTSYQR